MTDKVKVFAGQTVEVGDRVVHVTCSGNTIYPGLRVVTEISEGRIKLNNSTQFIRKPQNLIKVNY